MEHGFYHPEQGYWQAISEPSAEILAEYPEGTVRVPLKPGSHFEWLNEQWVYVPPPLEELAATARGQRASLLAASDWTQFNDARASMGEAKANAWDSYRQALRDLTEQPDFPYIIQWPVQPS